jgi:hypothetical protein
MPDPIIVIVNASHIVTDEVVSQWAIDIQRQVTEDFAPVWGRGAQIEFKPWQTWQTATREGVWPVYINKHSTDPTALGWHDNAGNQIMGRVFVGDCVAEGIEPSIDLSHEVLEIIGDPDVRQTQTLADGRVAALEMCDPVEDDIYGYIKGQTKVSDFVLPQYFRSIAGPTNVSRFDFMGHLSGPCPALTSGGYQSLYVSGAWTQIMARNIHGNFSHRALRHGRSFRRIMGKG